jgi:hypothetical protein
MVFLLGFQSKGQGNLFIAVDLYDGRRSPSSCRDNLIYNTVSIWSTRSLSATGSADTFVASLMTSFQSLSARGSLHDDKLWRLVVPCEDSRNFVLFNGKSIFSLKQKAVVSLLVLRASTRPSSPPYSSGATPHVRL